MKILDEFGEVSGLKINREKTHIMIAGKELQGTKYGLELGKVHNENKWVDKLLEPVQLNYNGKNTSGQNVPVIAGNFSPGYYPNRKETCKKNRVHGGKIRAG